MFFIIEFITFESFVLMFICLPLLLNFFVVGLDLTVALVQPFFSESGELRVVSQYVPFDISVEVSVVELTIL